MQKTDSEMSEERDECKPEQPSIPLQLNVVLRNATTIRQVQCTSNKQAFDKVAAGIPGLPNPMHASIGIWEKMVARRELDDPRSMHNPTGMRFAIMGNKTDMIKYNMTNHVAGDVTSYKTIMDEVFKASEKEASNKAALIAAYKAAEEEPKKKRWEYRVAKSHRMPFRALYTMKYNMTNHVAGDVTSYKTIMDAVFKASEKEASDKAALIAVYKAADEEPKKKRWEYRVAKSHSMPYRYRPKPKKSEASSSAKLP